MKEKSTKLDIRLTPQLDKWLSSEANRLTISKSGFARMVLEKIRVESESDFDEDRDQYFKQNDSPKKPKAFAVATVSRSENSGKREASP